MNVSLTDKQERYIRTQIEQGEYQNASELVRDALRLHQVYREKLVADLRQEIEKGWAGETSASNVLDVVNEKTSEYKK